MVLTPRLRHATFIPAQVSGFYFRPCCADNNEVILKYFRCCCGRVRKLTRRNSYTNLMQHVRREDPDYETVMLTAELCTTLRPERV